MNDGAVHLEFENRKIFREWLENNYDSCGGIWVVLLKKNKEFTAGDALEEALCFGWIDGLMKSIDETKYKKYFSRRKDKANWSQKNRILYKNLEEKGLITEAGRAVYQFTENDSKSADKSAVNAANIAVLKDTLKNEADMLELFSGLSASRQKQLAGFYCEAKTEITREKRKVKIIEALKSNFKGMLF